MGEMVSYETKAKFEDLRAENARLRAALKGIAEYCSVDGSPLGAIARLTAIRNTAEQAVRAHEQSAQSPEGIAQSKVRSGAWPP